ncbi:hypothetical protein HPB51_000622 [Rhipicephalus microplus]|uniref:CUB domain-containing protein n=1 Tax=Rhipicephalus microplus TaxID=6941 RepID=A0A9J6E5X8_RHIMP|nr:hypothetical protein HPB51_000622 [Rhipicephalus microplus]
MERLDIIGPDVSHLSGVCSHDAFHYHEDPTGVISSFNYGSDSPSTGSGSGRLERGYPNFSRYSICFRLAAGACALRLAKDWPVRCVRRSRSRKCSGPRKVVRRRHNLDIDSAIKLPLPELFLQAPTTSAPQASAASAGPTSASGSGFQQEFPFIPETEVYTESGYFPEPDGHFPGGQIVLYHKGAYKDLAMKIVRNLVSVGRK